ncbi:hypothetical protein AVEN_110790-1, partial [Araneus ventricosus]
MLDGYTLNMENKENFLVDAEILFPDLIDFNAVMLIKELYNIYTEELKTASSTYYWIQKAQDLFTSTESVINEKTDNQGLRKVTDFRSPCDLILSDRIFETLDRELMTHIAVKQGESFFKTQQLGRECDVYLSSRGRSTRELISRNAVSEAKTIHFPRENSGNPASHLKLDAPVFVPKQNDKTAEANSQSQFVATGIEKGKPKNV